MLHIRRCLPLASLVMVPLVSVFLTGCRSSGGCQTCGSSVAMHTGSVPTPPFPEANGSPVVSLGAPVGQKPASRPFWQQLTKRRPRDSANKGTDTYRIEPPPTATSTPVAMMMPPLPAGAPLPVESSEWAPVQRVSGDGNAEGGVSTATIERPQPGMLPPISTSGNEPPLSTGTRLVLTDLSGNKSGNKDGPKKDKDDQKDKGKSSSTLPPPKPVNGGKKTNGGAWPELPSPAISNPPYAPGEFRKHALSAYVIEPPDLLQVELSAAISDKYQPITGPHLVKLDGTIMLGSYGSVFVAGMTIDQAKVQIIAKIRERQQAKTPEELAEALKVDVAGFNSKFYYVVTDGGGYGEQVWRVPCTGNETILDALSQIQGLPAVASKQQIWLARATPNDQQHPQILPVDWCSVVQRGSAATNYQVFPGDRIYVNSQKLVRIDTRMARIIAPIERILGITLLGATTVNAIKGNNQTGTGR